MRVLVAGASGLLGHALVPALLAAGLEVISHGNRNNLDVTGDLTSAKIARELIDQTEPDAVINLVALTNVDRCEEHPDEAYRLNVKVVENLVAGLAKRPDPFLVQISSDQVYDGEGPHIEGNERIINTYALSKYAGELAALRMPSTVLRTNFFGPSQLQGRPSFSDWLIGMFQKGEAFTGFDDVLFSPLAMNTLTQMIIKALEQRRSGLYNLGAREGLSKAEFGVRLAAQFGLDASNMTRGSFADVELTAPRPMDMRTDCSRFEKDFGVELPTLQQEITSLGGAV